MALPPPSETIALDDADDDSDHEAEDGDEEEDELDGDAGGAGEVDEEDEGTADDSDELLDSDEEDDEDGSQKPSAGGRPDGDGGEAAAPKERVTSAQRAVTEVFVGGLPPDATEEDVMATFSVAGDIAEVRMMRDRETGVGKGFAFVRYVDAESATTAVEHLDGIEVCGRTVGVVRSQANTRLFVAGFPREWLDDELSAALKQAQLRSVEEVQVALDPAAPAGHQGKGYAIVRFSTHSAAMFAMNALTRRGLSLGSIRSRRIKAEWAREAPSQEALEHVTTVLVTHLPPHWDADQLRALCEPFGTVVHVAHPKSMRQPQKQTDFGYVCFEDRPSAERAQAALHGMVLGGDEGDAGDGEGSHTLEAAFARPRQDKEHAGGGGAARGGRGGRSEGRGGRGRGRGRRDFDGGRGRHPGRGGGGRERDRPARESAPGGDSGPASLGRLVDAIKANTPAVSAPAQHVPHHQEQRLPDAAPGSDRHGSAPGRGKRDGGARHPSGRGGGGGGGGGRGGAKRPRMDGGRGGGRPPLLQAPVQQGQGMAAMAQQQGGYHHPYAYQQQQQQQQQQYAAMMQHQAHAQAAMAQHYAAMSGMPPHAHALMMQHAAAAAMAAMHARQQQQQQFYGGGWVAQPQQVPGPQGAAPAQQPPYGAQ